MQFLFLFFLLNCALAFDWQGHRGARGLYPENTIQGMREALKYPIGTLEMDVVITKDKKVILSHEGHMNPEICLNRKGEPLNNEKIYLYHLTAKEVEEYDCGTKKHPRFLQQKNHKEHKPQLTKLITELEKEISKLERKITYSVEIKSTPEDELLKHQPDFKEFTDLVLEILINKLPLERFVIQSFDWRVLKYIHQKYPKIRLVALREEVYPQEILEKELGFYPEIFSPDWSLLRPEHINYFHSKKVKVIPWTVNDVETIKKMLGLRVDGIITDYPNLITQIPTETYLSKTPPCASGENYFEGQCIKIPKNAIASPQNPGWICRPGYQQKRNSCVKIKIPQNAHFLEDGKTWVCNEGYERYRHRCRKVK
jgi:glycerophosphoryl diester phosphodiesterase